MVPIPYIWVDLLNKGMMLKLTNTASIICFTEQEWNTTTSTPIVTNQIYCPNVIIESTTTIMIDGNWSEIKAVPLKIHISIILSITLCLFHFFESLKFHINLNFLCLNFWLITSNSHDHVLNILKFEFWGFVDSLYEER